MAELRLRLRRPLLRPKVGGVVHARQASACLGVREALQHRDRSIAALLQVRGGPHPPPCTHPAAPPRQLGRMRSGAIASAGLAHALAQPCLRNR